MVGLDIILQMQKQGMTDYEISKTLQSQGISPREINEALNQAKIKSALSQSEAIMDYNKQNNYQEYSLNENNNPFKTPPIVDPYNTQVISQVPIPSKPGYSIPTVISDPLEEIPPQKSIISLQQEQYPQNQYNYPEDNYGSPQQNNNQNNYPPQNQYPENEYYQDGYTEDSGYASNESISEIAEQVINEKFREFNSKTGDLVSFRNNVEDELKSLNDRLKRIEDTIDKLQHAIIQKVGEFGENTTLIRRDLENLHNTTSKLMNPLIDNYRELEKRKK
jgi:hypothetical protein